MLKRLIYRLLFGEPAPFCRCGAFLGCFHCYGTVCARCRWEGVAGVPDCPRCGYAKGMMIQHECR